MNFHKRIFQGKPKPTALERTQAALKATRMGRRQKRGGAFETGWDRNKHLLTIVLYSAPIYGFFRNKTRFLSAGFTLEALLKNVPAKHLEQYARRRRAAERRGKGAGEKRK